MKTYLHAWAMCQSMFCALPFPWKIWDEEARDKMLLFLPIVGLVIGLGWYLLAFVLAWAAFPTSITAALLALYPFRVTGGMHLDGFMDVRDAVGSYRPLERRREILKDSHVGAFSVIGCVMLLLMQYAACLNLVQKDIWEVLLFIPVISRCGSALAVTLLPPMGSSQYAGQRLQKWYGVVLCVVLFVALGIGFCVNDKIGIALVIGLVGYGLALRKAYRSLEGMNGDIAGYALSIAELSMLLAAACL